MATEQDDMASPDRRVSRASHSISVSPEELASHSSQGSFVITSEFTLTSGNIREPAGQPPIVTSTPSSTSQTPTSSFPQFMKFPPEVRKMIWKFSFGGPKIFRPVPSTDQLTTWLTMMVDHKPPSSGAACQEARQLFHQCGEFLFGAEGLAIKALWFRPSEDILYWDHMLVQDIEYESYYYDDRDFTTIENVAINWRGRADDGNLQRLADALNEFRSCKRMILVMSHGRPPDEGDVEFLHIGDNDQRKVCYYQQGKLSWAGLKQALEEEYREEERSLPPLEAVEVVPRRTVSKSA
ncbi:hypothetical protein Neosp_006333 [[Neocosmospora] mangrovei]